MAKRGVVGVFFLGVLALSAISMGLLAAPKGQLRNHRTAVVSANRLSPRTARPAMPRATVVVSTNITNELTGSRGALHICGD
jgi:hypothetical protein